MNRSLVLGAAWTASAAAAVGLGFLAVSLVDASASPGTQQVAASTTASVPSTSPSTSPTAAPTAAAPGEQVTVGGTVFAACTSGAPDLASAPAPGWWVDDSSDQGEVEFRNGSQKVEVHTVCVDGGPQFSVEGPRADGGSSASTTPGPTTPAAPSSADDSSGRGGGGHGSDDPAGDDSYSSGRGGGGHGGDD
ncbi:hypothetical protein [Blastococcus sp. CT_GayMR16]|uniref:hypothetical protein n=1 Tax=Blastococcus sp. CT_GayMR16 TaxID=2559607 RepID=UPI001072FA8A|nr:hypothetical protein [Blastococcus sp. CT_GayMR16]TFV83440.1 hypothetical protein E4P38_19970 [Blastococcus sp. CT_GayMR16]